MSEDVLKAWRAFQEQAMRDLGNEGAGAYAGSLLRWSHIDASPFLSELIANWAVDVWRLVQAWRARAFCALPLLRRGIAAGGKARRVLAATCRARRH